MIEALKRTPKFIYDPKPSALWVWPHEGAFAGEGWLADVTLIDALDLQYEAHVTIKTVRDVVAKKMMQEHGFEAGEAYEQANAIKGFWVVPHTIWRIIGCTMDMPTYGDTGDYVAHEIQQRVAACMSILHVGVSNPLDA